MKIAKYIQQAGLASRRQAEDWVRAGRVRVEGLVMTNPAMRLDNSSDILLDGKKLPAAEIPKIWIYHKPAGLLVSRLDPQGRRTIYDELPAFAKNLMSVGRLDLSSEGLLLLTNNGALARTLELPKTGLVRKYRVRVFGDIDVAKLKKLEKGLVVDGVRYAPAYAQTEGKKAGSNQWLSISLKEGKNREVRILMETLGLKTNRLIRVSYGDFKLGKLLRGGLKQCEPAQFQKWL